MNTVIGTQLDPSDILAPRVLIPGRPAGRIGILADGRRLFVTTASPVGVVFDWLGAAPVDAETPETVVKQARGVRGGTFVDFAGVMAHIEACLAPDLALLKTTLKALATQRRWETETGGIEIAGMHVATDDRTKTLLTGADRRARRDPNYTTEWKGAGGVWVPLNSETIISLADQVFDHVDRCFAEERRLHQEIDAAADEAAVLALRTAVQNFIIFPY